MTKRGRIHVTSGRASHNLISVIPNRADEGKTSRGSRESRRNVLLHVQDEMNLVPPKNWERTKKRPGRNRPGL